MAERIPPPDCLYRCPCCNLPQKSFTAVVQHMKSVHISRAKYKFVCSPRCAKTFANRDKLTEHREMCIIHAEYNRTLNDRRRRVVNRARDQDRAGVAAPVAVPVVEDPPGPGQNRRRRQNDNGPYPAPNQNQNNGNDGGAGNLVMRHRSRIRHHG